MNKSLAGRILMSTGVVGLGVVGLIYGDFALQWQPVPEGIPGRTVLAYISGFILVVAGLGMQFRRTLFPCALVLTIMMVLWVLLLHSPKVIAGHAAAWLPLFEFIALAGAFWIVVVSAAPEWWRNKLPVNAGYLGKFCFAISLPAFGLSHFLYAQGAVGLIPAWIPWPLFWTYFTGVAHIAAGISILTNILSQLAATLLATMFSLFVLLLHLSRVITSPGSRLEWTMIFVAITMTGAAWLVAGSIKTTSKQVNSQPH